jgi:tRNA G18 (ribose-2'-O)-methylase SpoU
MPRCILIIHNIRSCYNVGSIFRTADGLGVEKIYITGYSPYPATNNDSRLPYLAQKIDHQIHKTALGAEKTVSWEYIDNVCDLITKMRSSKFQIVGLEQTPNSLPLQAFKPNNKTVLIVGREIGGIEKSILELTDLTIEIPMFGTKNSFNVAQATAIALYHIKTFDYK